MIDPLTRMCWQIIKVGFDNGFNVMKGKIHYTHVENLSLATVNVVQRLRHYILLHQTMVVDHINPFQFVPAGWMLG